MEVLNNRTNDTCKLPTPRKIEVKKVWWGKGKIKSIISYKDDYLHGEFMEWYPNGQLTRRCNYKDGKLQPQEGLGECD